jgi:hypothetical protein
MKDGGMKREIADLVSDSIKGNPRCPYEATGESLTLAFRLRHPPMIKMSCGIQPANIRLINRREQFPFSSHYRRNGSIFTLKKKSENNQFL